MSKTPMLQAIEEHIKDEGIGMSKQISSGGFLSSPTYDNRRVYSLEDLYKLNAEGFSLDEDSGAFLLNAFLKDS